MFSNSGHVTDLRSDPRARLNRVKQRESINQMTGSNLAIVFGPNLLGQPPAQYYTNGQGPGGQATNSQTGTGTALADMQWQCKVIETILHHYAEIFLDVSSFCFFPSHEQEESGAPRSC